MEHKLWPFEIYPQNGGFWSFQMPLKASIFFYRSESSEKLQLCRKNIKFCHGTQFHTDISAKFHKKSSRLTQYLIFRVKKFTK